MVQLSPYTDSPEARSQLVDRLHGQQYYNKHQVYIDFDYNFYLTHVTIVEVDVQLYLPFSFSKKNTFRLNHSRLWLLWCFVFC